MAKNLVTILREHAIVLLSKRTCGFCVATKDLLATHYPKESSNMLEIDVGDPTNAPLQAQAYDLTGQRTVPNLFVRGKSLGGNSDIQKLHSKGLLKARLEA